MNTGRQSFTFRNNDYSCETDRLNVEDNTFLFKEVDEILHRELGI